ncbi:beta-ketoacyl synthase N-terminal-like domain-containing protein [Streptosporangium sp. NPDC050855]|uniref:beta-ketoacyl synthase N-terminal-like domain-containing protein n=1 Tax=Streptosporangium sp. NPDC050855 TaxID=3366194 RepID=UPI0037A6D038
MALRPVVVTGLGIICAAGRDPAEFWTRLTTARGGLTPIEDEAFAVFTARYAGQVPDAWIDEQLPADEAAGDRTARLALVAARQAVEQAGQSGQSGQAGQGGRTGQTGRPGQADPVRTAPDPGRFGVILGKCQATPGPGGSYQPMHHTADVIAERLGLGGPRILVSTACAAGGNAVGLARDKILTGEADAVLAGGVDPLLFGTYAGFAGLQALSTGPCRPYSHSDGLNLGEGAAFLLLEPLDLALARGATPLAEVAGYGLSADAYHATAPDPTGRGGAGAMRRALAEAGLTPDDVHYVSGHGTGTPANDTMEAKVMRLVFGDRAPQVPTSSIKSFVGHTLGAAGAVEAVASVLALRHGVAPPTIGFDDDARDDARADLDYVPNRARKMAADTVVSNNYAFGGNNVSLVLTRPRDPAPYGPTPRREAVITGLGPVTGAGTGIAETAAAITAGRRADGRDPSLEGRTFAPRSLWRHMNRLSRLAIAASRLAWEDAGLKLPRKELDDVALVFATGAGSAESTGGFDDSIALNPNKPAVLSFSNVVLNATGGAVCQTLGLRGPTTTLCNGAASASIALDCALEMIDAGKAEVVLVVAADETAARHAPEPPGTPGTPEPPGTPDVLDAAGPVPYGAQAAAAVPVTAGSAAVAFVVESAEHCAGRGGRPYARVAGTRHAAGRGAEPVTRSLALPGTAPGLVVGAATGLPRDGEEAAAVLARMPDALLTASAALIGDCQAATGAMNIALAALAVRDGLAPALTGLAAPLTGDRGSYVTRPELAAPVASALALTAAHDSVRGAVLLEAP